ncbi:P-loop containing nucleoside triphosphate hydrolase protein [Pilatotrama ljubarskyi]|nr:P-loop containing nucleoside triphosphate hydrolase protein [Pilatotrama ljubarskyi]
MAPVFCPATLYAGGCDSPDCALTHDVKFCNICAIVCYPADVYNAHVQGKQHRANLSASSTSSWLLCGLCNVKVSGEAPWAQHIAGAAHKKKAHTANVSPSVYPRDPAFPDAYRCVICQRAVPEDNWWTHLRSTAHLRQQKASVFRAKFERASQDRRGVVVSHADSGINFGVISRAKAQTGVYIEVTVTTNVSSSSISLSRAECHANATMFSPEANLSFTASIIGEARKLVLGQVIRIHVTFRQTQRGRYQGRLELTLQDASQRAFIIIRQLYAVVGNKEDHELLKAVAPYVHRRPAKWQPDTSTVEGQRPPALDVVKWARPLPQSAIPARLAQALSVRSTREAVEAIRTAHLPSALSVTTHGRHFQILLWVEEQRLVEDLRMYDLADTSFTKEGQLYILAVPGLAEKRPSVVIGDTILAQSVSGGSRTYVGYVHGVRLENIRVHFHYSFKNVGRYNVRFQYNRTPIKRQHQALLAQSTSAQRLLFPLPVHVPLDRPIRSNEVPLVLFNTMIGSNAAQLQAVRSVLRMKAGAAPFIIFGPPGTGKTVTVVEAIRQILRGEPNARILACAPSNSAADLIAQRLLALKPAQLFRCNAIFRSKEGLPDDLLPYSSFRDSHFSLPPLKTLLTYRVIVSTCGNASFPYNIGMPLGHFTHIFIDEAGQGSEPEVLTAAIKTLVANDTRVVLSGDPKQLGPVIRSSIARELGLGKSYLERLMERPVYYDASTGRGRSFIKLVKNFRSHGTILAYPNEKFYDGELEVCGAPSQINSFLDSAQLVSPRFPIVFHAIAGENERESSSPSYFNIDEATEVVEYIKELLKDRRHPIRAKDIGVITPYFAQVRKIRKLLQRANINDLKVASVEEFQGQERRVIIISTVRSNRDLLSYDAKFTLGFVSNPRRFNVAITRAQALLIVIGDPSILSVDPMWRGFMNYIYLRGGWRGDEPTWDTSAPVRTEGNYAAEMREAAAAEMDALIARLAEGEDLEGEANFDQAFVEAE